ncbi:MAG TPA: glycoside hydrolase family 2 TIM barrel-domain containing protein [Candidatus Bathyarchaeia archaeon]|nr:glycoside hydrolase family 2 TIM barrel-domain containing protein [Candidatus Bathyarchaeia archaeon]
MSEKSNWVKKDTTLTTPWFEGVSVDNPFPDYPRPQFVRDAWINLNGLWNYAITSNKIQETKNYDGKILVPYPLESALSGVKKQLRAKQFLWYHRVFTIPKHWEKNRILLHFGAVDWECKVCVNDVEVAIHKGGYTPFSIDITDIVITDGENHLRLRVYDPSEKGKQPSGKQWIKPGIVFYTTISGIWQTVWLESVPKNYISDIRMIPDIDRELLRLEINTEFDKHLKINNRNDTSFELKIRIPTKDIVLQEITNRNKQYFEIPIPKAKLWTPETPHLYELEIELLENKEPVDKIKSYFAMRKFSLAKDSNGYLRFHLNNKPYFMTGLLDQGYWPDGLYTAPSDEALKWDIELTKEFGFNTIRKHIKTEPARWYHYCDKLGVLVWQDMVNGGGKKGIISQFLAHIVGIKLQDTRCYWKSGQGKKSRRANFERELKEMIDTLFNVPSICLWVPFNEAWGQYDSLRISQWVMNYDPTRLVDHASGWFDHKGGNFISIHDYADKFNMPTKSITRGVLLSETGGYTRMIPNHSWNPKKKYGYKNFHTQEEVEQAYRNLVENILLPAKKMGLSGVIYTQTSDVEIEYNGLITYDRKVKKMNPEKIAKLNNKLNEKK